MSFGVFIHRLDSIYDDNLAEQYQIVLLGLDAPHGAQWIGVVCMLSAASAYALAPLVMQRYLHGAEGLGPSAVSLAIASLLLCPAGLRFLPASLPSSDAIACLVGLGAVCTASGMLLYFVLVKATGAARAGVVKYLSPIVAALLGTVALGEAFPFSSIVGMIMILIGSWFATREGARHGNDLADEKGAGNHCPAAGVRGEQQ